LAIAAFLALVLTASSAHAEIIIDLTTYGASGSSQGAKFVQVNPQPTGTGFVDPFVRIQRTGTESGYNTDGQIEFDTKDQGGHNWTHALLLSNLNPVMLNGTAYYEFILDVNESANDAERLLSLNDFRLYLGDAPNLTNWNDGFGANSQKVYDIDAAGNTTVELDYKLNSGSGSGDMSVFVPVSLFQGYGPQYQWVYLYSAFGQPNGSSAGFEEWWAKTVAPAPPPVGAVPAPPAVVLAGVGLACCLLGRALRRKTLVPVT